MQNEFVNNIMKYAIQYDLIAEDEVYLRKSLKTVFAKREQSAKTSMVIGYIIKMFVAAFKEKNDG